MEQERKQERHRMEEERKQERGEAKEAIARIEQERKQERIGLSVLSVLRGNYLKDMSETLICTGTPGSHMYPPNKQATGISFSKKFSSLDLVKMYEDHDLQLEMSISSLRATIEKRKDKKLSYANEADVQHIVQCALEDSTFICNRIIEDLAGDLELTKRVVLETRLESAVFSNVCDHVVVYDSMSGTPVFVAETKKPWGDMKPTPNVFGQVFDQLMATKVWGHQNPYGALTCYDKTYIVCLVNEVPEEKLNWDRLREIVASLPRDSIDPTGRKTPSTVKERSPERAPASTTQASNETSLKFTTALRQVKYSREFGSSEMIPAFVTAIFCSLAGFCPREINNIQQGSYLEAEALSITSKSYKWGKMQATCHGPYEMRSFSIRKLFVPKNTFYLVDYLGMGATSKAYRALTSDGFDCVVKMYVKRRDDKNEFLDWRVFTKIAKAAVRKEVEAFKEIYPDLKQYVGGRILNGFPCVIHPYFKHPTKDERVTPLLDGPIRDCLEQKFGLVKKKFQSFDQLWQHIGVFNETLYLFDLGDLVPFVGDDTIATVTKIHIDRLKSRIPDN